MIPICMIAEKLSSDWAKKIQGPSLTHIKDVFEAGRVVQENPDTVFLWVMKSEEETLEFLRSFSNAVPESRIVLLAGMISPGFETQAMAAGCADILSSELPFTDLKERVERIGKHSKKKSHRGFVDSILIVDDDQGVRNFLGLVFKKKGFETILAESGQQAIEAVQNGTPSVVLLDMMMPGMDGLETLKKLRQIKPNLGVVMATGLCDEVLALQSMQLGAYAYVVKPFDLSYLEMVVLTRLCLAA